jgi:hypothetical protein
LAVVGTALSLALSVAPAVGATEPARPRPTRKLSPSEVLDLEKKVTESASDLEARGRLLRHYLTEWGDTARAARARHVLRIVANAPEAEIAGRPEAGLNKRIDTESYAEARALWVGHLESNPQNTRILANAAQFFLLNDRGEAERLFKRSAQIEPANWRWNEKLGQLYELEAQRPDNADPDAAKKALAQYEAALAAGSPRAGVLAHAAQCALWADDDATAAAYASELLAIVGGPAGRADGDAIHDGHRILGHVALNRADVEGAKRHLLESAKTPGSPVLNSFGPELTLANDLLKKGERDTVIQYREILPRFWQGRQEAIDQWVILIRAGKVPDLNRFAARHSAWPRSSSVPATQR